jgi:hypothetical protein
VSILRLDVQHRDASIVRMVVISNPKTMTPRAADVSGDGHLAHAVGKIFFNSDLSPLDFEYKCGFLSPLIDAAQDNTLTQFNSQDVIAGNDPCQDGTAHFVVVYNTS